ncbi:GIY-YIG nuclease family protein [bacterium]|nr:GIY-YIG nuclease family protein [bacterium]
MRYFVYILKSIKKKYFYIGLTNNLARRIKEHNSEQNKSTKAFAPYKLIAYWSCCSRREARKLEKKLKSGYYREQIYRGKRPKINAGWSSGSSPGS